jgi:hypothetical protein
MTDDRPSDLLSALPRSRPHRRSAKRPARPAAGPEAEAHEATQAPSENRGVTTKPAADRAKADRAKASSPRSGAQRSKSARPTAKSNGNAAKASKTRSKATKATKTRSEAKPSQPTTAAGRAIPSAGEAQGKPSRQPTRLAQPAQPRGVPRSNQGARPEPSTEFPVLRTAVQAAAELTEIGATLSAKALRRVLGRFPRP